MEPPEDEAEYQKLVDVQLRRLFRCNHCREVKDDSVVDAVEIDCLRHLCPSPCSWKEIEGQPSADAIWQAFSVHIGRMTELMAGMMFSVINRARNSQEHERN